MSDRYLCKAKRTDNGEWVEGLLTIMWRQYHIINPSNENIAYAIDETALCQYTGLTDKNGQKIWENDIVKDDVIFGNVVWDEHYVQFMINDVHDGHQEYTDWWNGVEVCGNIFDNPELLGGDTVGTD